MLGYTVLPSPVNEPVNMSTAEDVDHPVTVDDEAYEPTYTEAFPPLPSASSGESEQLQETAWPPKTSSWSNGNVILSIHPSVVTQVVKLCGIVFSCSACSGVFLVFYMLLIALQIVVMRALLDLLLVYCFIIVFRFVLLY